MLQTYVFKADAGLGREIEAVAKRRWLTCTSAKSLLATLLGLRVEFRLEGAAENLAVARRDIEALLQDARDVQQW